MSRSRSLRRLFGFLVIPMLGALSPLIALPAVTAHFGAHAWAAVAIGQSIGGAAAVIVELGWALNGPQRVARATAGNRRQMLAAALATKLVVYLPMAALAVTISVLLAPAHQFESALVAAGTAGVGLSSAWFFVGSGSPGRIMMTDSLPRIIAVAAAALGIGLGGPLWIYGLAIAIPSALSPVLAVRVTGVSRHDFRIVSGGRLLWAIKAQAVALSGRAVSALYIALPITLVGIASPQSVAVFAGAERLQRMALTVLQAVPNYLQGWVGGGKSIEERLDRAIKSILYNGVLGIIAGTGFALLAPTVAHFVFSGVVALPYSLSALSGLLIFIVCVSRATGNITLVALRKINIISLSALTGAAVGVPAILVFSSLFGPHGALVGELLAEGTVLAIQLIAVVVYRRRRGTNGDAK